MKLENLPKIFAATLLAVTLTVFQQEPFKTLKDKAANLVGGLGELENVHKFAASKALPSTSLQVSAGTSISLPDDSTAALMEPIFTVAPAVIEYDPTLAPFLTPEFEEFLGQVEDGPADQVQGIYVEGVLANKVVHQPQNDWAFVSQNGDVITEFQSARRNGTTGLLAHNYLLGEKFYNIEIGSVVGVVYGDGSIRRYLVSRIDQFQKLDTSSLTSDMIDLTTNERLTSTDVFNRFYNAGDQVTFQTCLARNGNSSWGLTFFVAEPID